MEPIEKPKPLGSHGSVESRFHPNKKRWHIAGVVVLCFVASFLGAWVLLATGLVKPDATQTLTNNRQQLVLQQGEIVAEVFKKVSPSTVSITIKAVNNNLRGFSPTVSEGAGSGIIVSRDGYVLTNKHVVPASASQVTVVLADGTEYKNVQVVGRDPVNDIAFLKIKGVSDLPAASLGDSSQVIPGQQVVAIGNALGIFRNSVTAGIISGLGRPIAAQDSTGTTEQLENLFQTDAAINPGNSGGPLVNLKGEVIGVNTAVSQEGQGIGFAIPINDAKGMIESVKKTGRIVKPYLGVRYIPLTPEIAKELNVTLTQGAVVTAGQGEPAVVPGSPAAKAGIKEGDIITKVNGASVSDTAGLATRLAQFAPGDKVQFTVVRNGQEMVIGVTLGTFPNS